MSVLRSDVATRLYEDIVIGVHGPGNKLVEERLAKVYDTKRHILRDAFNDLEELGLVDRIPNRGVFVREPHPREVRELYKMRTLLECSAVREMTLPAPDAILDKMREIQSRHSKAIENRQFRDVLHLNTEFHDTQYSVCQNKTLQTAIQFYATRTHQITAMKFSNGDLMDQVVMQHGAIIDAMAGTDKDLLESCVLNHFNMVQVDQYETAFQMRHGDFASAAARD